MYKNNSIKCEVSKCKHNVNGCNCNLSEIRVTCGCGDENCTCCGDFQEEER